MNRATVSLTLKNVPSRLHRQLKARAREHKRSLNQEAILCLEQILADTGGPTTSLTSPPAPVSAGALIEPWKSRADMLEGFLDRHS